MAQHYGNEVGYVSCTIVFFSPLQNKFRCACPKSLVICSLSYVKWNVVCNMDAVGRWFLGVLIQQGNERPNFLPTLTFTKLYMQVTDKRLCKLQITESS